MPEERACVPLSSSLPFSTPWRAEQICVGPKILGEGLEGEQETWQVIITASRMSLELLVSLYIAGDGT